MNLGSQSTGELVRSCTVPNSNHEPSVCTVFLDETDREFLLSEPPGDVIVNRESLCPEILLQVCGKPTMCLLDSGAEISCVAESFCKELNEAGINPPVIPVPRLRIIGATCKASPVINKQVILSIEGLGSPKTVSALVIHGLSKMLILGVEFLSQHKIQLDFGGWLISTPGSTTYDVRSPESWSYNDCFVGSLSTGLFLQQTAVSRVQEVSTLEDLQQAVWNVETITSEQRHQLLSLLSVHRTTFSEKPGRHKYFRAEIKVNACEPFHNKSYPIPAKYLEEAESYLKLMLDWNIVKHATSPFASPMLCVRKSDGSLRLCVDARALNAVTIKSRESVRPTEELLRLYQGVKYMTSIDLTHSYWQLPLEQDSQQYTGFLFRNQQYVFQVMPFGLCNAVALFTRCMNVTLGEECNSFARAYIDDLLITSETFEEHLEHINLVLSKLKAAGMTAKLRKSQFCREEVPFLGHIITSQGIRTAPDKLKAITQFPEPQTLKQLRAFLGIVGFYRNYSDQVAKIALPLFELLRKDTVWDWTRERQQAFEGLKQLFLTEHVIHHPQSGRDFIVYTDASSYALGVKLAQCDNEGVEKTVAMASRTLCKAEKNYTVTEKEMLCIVWALQKFRHLLLGEHIVLRTDHQALLSLRVGRIFSSRLTRWQLLIQEFNIEYKHIKGTQNVVADLLSRIPDNVPSRIDSERKLRDYSVANIMECKVLDTQWSTHLTHIQEEQDRDDFCLKVRRKMEEAPPEHPVFNSFCISNDGLLFQQGKIRNRLEEEWKLVVPRQLRVQLITDTHGMLGHVGIAKTYEALRKKFYFHGMQKIVNQLVRTCDVCQRCKRARENLVGEPQSIIPRKPLDLVSVDLYGPLPRSQSGVCYIFVMLDIFTKYTKLFPIVKANAQTLLKKVKIFSSRVGPPKCLLSDKGSQFTGHLWQSETRKMGIVPTTTAVRTPQCNPVEREMQTLGNMFRALCSHTHQAWKMHLPLIEFVINNTVHESTTLTPFEALTGQPSVIFDPRKLPQYPKTYGPPPQLYEELRQDVHRMVRDRLIQAAARRKKSYKVSRKHKFNVGDRVLVKTAYLSSKSQHIFSKFMSTFRGPFNVTAVFHENNYELRREGTNELIGRFNIRALKPYRTEDGAVPV